MNIIDMGLGASQVSLVSGGKKAVRSLSGRGNQDDFDGENRLRKTD
jgi:hypothetical protein